MIELRGLCTPRGEDPLNLAHRAVDLVVDHDVIKLILMLELLFCGLKALLHLFLVLGAAAAQAR